MTTAAITVLEMFTRQQTKLQQRRCSHDSSHHSTEDVHTTTAAITILDLFTQQQLPSHHRRCSHNNSVLMTTASITV